MQYNSGQRSALSSAYAFDVELKKMNSYEKTIELQAKDHPSTLFPLQTNRILSNIGAEEIGNYIYTKIAPSQSADASFLAQQRVYATKSGLHLRRTHKLDPVAEFFLYDIAWSHRTKFRDNITQNRVNFGYRFKDGMPISPSKAYKDFKNNIIEASRVFRFYTKFDIASYFNSIYHHDLAAWFSEIAESEEVNQLFGKFFRQINSGRSIDCLTQGIIPSKIFGSQFLQFVDNSPWIRSNLLLRFMDDIYLFSDEFKALSDDFLVIQGLIGEKGLSINPQKTHFGEASVDFVDTDIDKVRTDLLQKRMRVFQSSGDIQIYEDVDMSLAPEQEEYLFDVLKGDSIEEDDAELVLALMREHGNDLIQYLGRILTQFPHLARNVSIFCDHVTDLDGLSSVIQTFLKHNVVISEFQLFWIAKIVEEKLMNHSSASNVITGLYEHRSSTKVSRAKLLEIQDTRYGLRELRSEHLRTGASDWLTWSSAVGCLAEKKVSRNHALGYFANGSQMNQLISSILKKHN